MTNYLQAKVRKVDGALLLETTAGEYVHENQCGPGMHNAKLYRTNRVSAHKQQMGVVAFQCDDVGRIVKRPS